MKELLLKDLIRTGIVQAWLHRIFKITKASDYDLVEGLAWHLVERLVEAKDNEET